MKKKLLLLGTLLLIQISVKSQIKKGTFENYVLEYSGEITHAKKVIYNTAIFKENYISADTVKFDPRNVRFFYNENGFYANTKRLNTFGTIGFTERIIEGNVNLYEKELTYNYNTGFNNVGYGTIGGVVNFGLTTENISNIRYYNIGFRELKRVNYQNLSEDLSDNLESMLHLDTYKKVKKRERLFYIIGTTMIFTGAHFYIKDNRKSGSSDRWEKPTKRGLTIALLGFGTNVVNYILGKGKDEHIINAIETYNE